MNEIVYVKAIMQGELPSGQKLVKLVASNTDGIKPFYTSANDIIRHKDAEEQRMLLKLPCKVGDYVYQIDRMLWKIHTRKVSKIESTVTATDSVMTIYFETAGFCYLSHFGKTVFLDKKDALNALDPYLVE